MFTKKEDVDEGKFKNGSKRDISINLYLTITLFMQLSRKLPSQIILKGNLK